MGWASVGRRVGCPIVSSVATSTVALGELLDAIVGSWVGGRVG